MTNPPLVRSVCLVLTLLAVLLPVGANPVPPSLSQVVIIPASAGTPPSFTGMVTGGPPNGTARLQASVDMGEADSWSNIALAALDNLGSATFTNIPDSRPQADAAQRDFFRVSTVSTSPILDGFALIPAGRFLMGDQLDPLGEPIWELPVHSVYVSAFYMGKYEVTKELWDEVRVWGLNNGYTDLPVGNGSYASKGANHPVHSINWYAMVKWCNARSQKEGLTPCYTVSGATYKTGQSSPVCNWSANGHRLPTEAEWENAARGGLNGQNFPWGNTISHNLANFSNSGGETYQTGTTGSHPIWSNNGVYQPYSSPVGSFAPNGYGLYDMAGNMVEWCWDRFSSSYYASSPGTDPRGAASGSARVYRGGYWGNFAIHCRVSSRHYLTPASSGDGYLGFRVARSSVP